MVYSGTPLSENFDSFPATASSTAFPNNGATFPANAAPTALGSTGWVGARIGGSGTGTMARTIANNTVNISTGAIITAGTTAERAIGTYFSTAHQPSIGVEIQNNTGLPIVSVTITFVQENWQLPRDPMTGSAAVNTTVAEYGTTDGGLTAATFLAAAPSSFSVATNLNLVSPDPVANSANNWRNGNLIENQVARSATINLSATPIGAGESFFLRFLDLDNPGTDAIMAIDDFTFSAVTVPEPSALLTLSVGMATIGLFVVRRRK
jgi:hypothetical protein